MTSNQHSTRERDQATATNPQSRGGLLPLYHGGSVGDHREVGESTGDGFGSVFPLILAGSASILWLRVSLLPPRENASGSLFIGVLGQARQSKIKTYGIGGSRSKRDMVADACKIHVRTL
jgi:hypothetical protein